MAHVSVDIGASSGRLVLGVIENSRLKIKEIHRFRNGFTKQNGTCIWDVDHLLNEIVKGLEIVKLMGTNTCTVGIDTWAVDYVLIGDDGKRFQEAVSYRDDRTKNSIEKITKMMTKEEIYQKTGIQFQPFNTIYQLFEEDSNTLAHTTEILMMPDYLGYCLTGVKVFEESNASTTQLLNVHTRQLDEELLALIPVKEEKFPPIVEPGTILGDLKRELFPAFDLPECKIITVATHDTASAVIGTPGFGDNWAYLRSGTWSLLGIESDTPITSNLALSHNYTNEWGAFRTIRFLKNIIGMWVIQEVKRNLHDEYSFSQFVEEAKKVTCEIPFVNFNDSRFMNPENMVDEIQNYCQETHQTIPETIGEMAHCIYVNLAIIYAIALHDLEEITGKEIHQLHIVGGGANNEYLNQLTADISGKTVYAGPTEATAIGNLIMQMIATKEIESLEIARQLIKESFEIKQYSPTEIDPKSIIQKFKEVVL